MLRVAILIAASPTRAFYSQIAVLRLALGQLRWSRWRFSLHVYLGGPQEPGALEEWSPYLGDVDIHWASAAAFAGAGDWAQSDDVFASPPADADVMVALDADTFPVDTLEPILDRVLETRTVAGVIAHYPTILPFTFEQDEFVVRAATPACPDTSVRTCWSRVSRGLIDAPLEFSFSHTLMGIDAPLEHREAPFYLNFGVVFFARAAFDKVAPAYLGLRPQLMERLASPDFSGQVALTLAIAAKRARTWTLPMRYNFPNDPIAERMYPAELEHIAVYHYLRTAMFDRHRIFASAGDYENFLARPLEGVNRRFQQAVRKVVGESYPFA